MNSRLIRRALSLSLALALAAQSWGPRAAAAAQEVAASAAEAAPAAAPIAPVAPALAPLAPLVSPPAALPSLGALSAPIPALSAAPAVSAQAAPTAASPASAAAAPAAFDAPPAAPDAVAAAAPAAFEAAPKNAPSPAVAAPARAAAAPEAAASRLGALFDGARAAADDSEALPPASERRARSAYFPLAMSAATGGVGLGLKGVGVLAAHALPAAGLLHAATLLVSAAAVGVLGLSGGFAALAVFDAAAYALATRRGRGVSDEDFRAFLLDEVLAGRLDANAAALIKPYRPQGRAANMTFAFAARGSIWVRPELISTPWLLRLVLLHELRHWSAAPTRGPPRSGWRGVLSRAAEESWARAAELRGPGALKTVAVSAVERALHQARVSLRRDKPYRILVVNPGSPALADAKLYEGLSGGAATVVERDGSDPAAALGEAPGAYRAVVLGAPGALVPEARTREAERLENALAQFDSLDLLSARLLARPQPFAAGSAEARAFDDLTQKARRLRAGAAGPQVRQAFQTEVARYRRQLAAAKLKGVPLAELAARLYAGLDDRGLAFLSFGPEDRGERAWERLARHWESEDGGRFSVTRVDLEDGGNILILRKFEPRVGLWLRPANGGRLAVSVPRANESPEGYEAARRALVSAGLADQLKMFDDNGVVVRHVFGADVGRQEIYVTVPRRKAGAIRRFVQARSDSTIGRSRADFEPHLLDSAGLMGVPPVWKAGITGSGGKILWIDTGADATHEDFAGRLDVVDMVDEGPEDWLGHGTHVAGISLSGGAPFLGMAPGARGTMAKVFSREGAGASDGEIMGSAAIAVQKGFDVISLSLGSRGSSADNLSQFLSRLTRQKNSAGDYPIVSASAGNAGPFDRSVSQPAAGVEVLAVAAAAKSLDDGRPEVAFYSSVGPDLDRRYMTRRLRLKPEIVGIGGDVVTSPGSANVYKFGVFSAKSKDAPPSPSDSEDGRHTGMSGTSMSNPAVAGIALLVKLAMKASGAMTPFVAENLPFAVKAVLMRSARDLQAPVWFQGAGLVDAGAAVALVARAAGRRAARRLRALAGLAEPDPDAGWGWIERLKAVADAEDRVFDEIPASASAAAPAAEGEGGAPEDEPVEDAAPDRAAADAARAAAAKRFSAARERERAGLVAALKDPVWLVRHRAALALLNLRDSAAALALGESALTDPDARVRQMALLALAEIPTHSVDALLRAASSDPRWDAGVYAAYALARHGDRGGVDRIVREAASSDKRARFAAVWLLGQLGSQATAAEAEALSARLDNAAERGNIRHLAAAALTNLADAAPQVLGDRTVLDMLEAAGPGNIALTRTLSRAFSAALRDRGFVERLRRDPLHAAVTDFVLRNKSALQRPGALAELVQSLARAAGVPLDAPTAPPAPSGEGVAGLDPMLGPLDVLVALGSGDGPAAYADDAEPAALDAAFARAGLGADFLSRFEARPRAALPLSGSLWLSVPEHKRYALSLALQKLGLKTRAVHPEFPLAEAGAPAADGVVVDVSADGAPSSAAEPAQRVSLRASSPVSEARAVATLERIAARAAGRPIVVSIALASSTPRRTALTALAERLVGAGVGVVISAGDGGPSEGTAAAPADALGPAVVGAASAEGRLQFYSARGLPAAPKLSWVDKVDALSPGQAVEPGRAVGTGAAAERSADALARLAGELSAAFAARGRTLPRGWFLWLKALARDAAAPMPGYAPHEVGAGLFDEGRARDELRRRLADFDAVAREMDAPPASAAAEPEEASRASFAPAASRAARGLLAAALAAGTPAPATSPAAWWRDPAASRLAVTVPLYSLRRENGDPGVGKFADLARYYREELAPEGVKAVLLLPHFAIKDQSPYAPVSLDAVDEDNIDWSLVPEVAARADLRARLAAPATERQSVDYADLRAREGEVARAAWADFARGELARGGERADAYRAFLRANADWLDDYAAFQTLSARLGKSSLDWTPEEVAAARARPGFEDEMNARRFAQWIGYGQLKDALDGVHRAGGKVLFDVPMFRAKDGVDAWRRPELFRDLRSRNPGIVNAWVHESWGDLALWNWTALRERGWAPALAPFRRWLDFGFDGARIDAFHFAYPFGNGQLASGDEPGDDYARALAAEFSSRGALPVAEAFEGKDDNARRLGFLTVGGEWRKVSSHDDPRQPGFAARLAGALSTPGSGASARFAAWTLGDEWGDPFPVKEARDGRSYWNYRIPLPSDADYARRAPRDERARLRVMNASAAGDPWKDPAAARALLTDAASGFVRREGGSVQIWAADMDWFLEEWGRDTFVSLPGLLLATGRFDEAKENIRRFARFEHDGLIPNKIWDASRWSPEHPDGADYNTSDGPMWFIQAVRRTAEASGDAAFADEMEPVIARIVARWRAGTGYERYGRFNRIAMDADGLVSVPAQSTWMDADPEGRDHPVTPRNGKPVEINALWYANLRFLAGLQRRRGEAAAAADTDALADRVKASFNQKFWFETEDNRKAWGGSGGALRDAVEGDPHGDAIRPNMVLAAAVGGDLLSPERRAAVVLAAARELLTPYGLRTLSPRDSDYHARYETWQSPSVKDWAYHQGTVWPWLMGAFIDALARVRREQGWSDERVRAEARGILTPLLRFLASRGEGTVSEVFDGGAQDPRLARFTLDDPEGLGPLISSAASDQNPGGTRSQAWSVAELLRAAVERGLVAPGYDGAR